MRIAFFLGGFPAVSETFILRQITGLIDQGHEVDIYAEGRPAEGTPNHPDVERYDLLAHTMYTSEHMPLESGYWEMPVWPLYEQTWLPGMEVPIPNEERALKAVPSLIQCLSAAPELTFKVLNPEEFGKEALSLSALYRLALLCSCDRKYEVLHAHFGPIGNTFRFARALFKAPFVVTFHGYDFSTVPQTEGQGVYERLFSTADAVTVNCEYARTRLEELGCSPDKIYRLNMGLKLADFPYKPRLPHRHESVNLLTVGRLVEKKGIEFSLRALAEARDKHPEIRYDIVGDGPLRDNLEKLARELRIENIVMFHGAQDGDYVRQMMSKSHLFLLTSVTAAGGDQEGTPVSLMEAQACGLPVLSSLHSGIPEIVLDGESGFLVPERDIASVSERLTYLLDHPQIWAEMGRKGRAHVEKHYDIQKLNRQLAVLYGALATKPVISSGFLMNFDNQVE